MEAETLCTCLPCRFGATGQCVVKHPPEPLTAEDIRLALRTPEQLVAEVDAEIRQQLAKGESK